MPCACGRTPEERRPKYRGRVIPCMWLWPTCGCPLGLRSRLLAACCVPPHRCRPLPPAERRYLTAGASCERPRSRMAMPLAGATMAVASSRGSAPVSLASSSRAAPASSSLARWSRRWARSAGAAVTAGLEARRLVGGRLADGGSSGASLVCRSSVSPLSDANGNVGVFQSEEEFDMILSEAGDKLVVVDISTTTCGPCKMIFPKLVEMSLAYPDAVFIKINGDTNGESRALMRKWGVRAVPNFRFFKNGTQVHSHTGAKVDELKTRFAEHYGQPIKV